MNRRRFLGTGALLFSGGCLQARPGTTPSPSSPSGRSTTKSNDNCQGGFEVEARPFTASEFTVQLSDDERELVAEAVQDGSAEVVSYGQPPLAADVFVEYSDAFYETAYSTATTEVPAYELNVSWERSQQAPDNATTIPFADLPKADQSALRLAIYGGEEGRVESSEDDERSQLPQQSLEMREFPAPYPDGGESSTLVDGGAVWVSWDDRIYRVELGGSTTTERQTRQYRVTHVADDSSAFHEALAAEFLIQFEELPKRERAIVEQAIDSGYEECTPASDALANFRNRLPEARQLPAPNYRSWLARFEGDDYLLSISQWVH